jgi:putative transposase
MRLAEFGYSQVGAYFVTICTCERRCILGEAVDGCIRLNAAGQAVKRFWVQIPSHFPGVELDAFVIMPNHIHGILRYINVVAGHARPWRLAIC